MKKLRAPNGCPWDRKQTPQSITPFLLEETHEVIECVDNHDWDGLKEELGDLLLHVVFQSVMACEAERFTLEQVLSGINEKLIRRHPHIFGKAEVADEHEVRKNWESIKMAEGKKEGRLDGVPKALPSLTRSARLQSKAASVGFDWHKIEDVKAKIDEEWQEFHEAVEQGEFDQMEEEFGDLLFSLVNLARWMKIDPEKALRRTIEKFIMRFRAIEEELKQRGKKPENSTLEEMDSIWEQVKKQL
ncbi:MAG: nucleoside triphosphate pyrophosphohydrolase [Candidatus Marinimicrobia bacterium]|nr:nucleoside triphosphate pyrophosphohydrolase [Candidatus Neomarinimicrobiota bacterium]